MAPTSRSKYSKEALDAALAAVRNGMAKREAAKKFGIPRTSLYDALNNKYREGKGKGRDPYLGEENEESLVK